VRLNGLPVHATVEVIQEDGSWRVLEFAWQMDAILFWDRFEGRWLRGSEFHYPARTIPGKPRTPSSWANPPS
jgi:hypothetical protein